jgi:four helix bundle protein
MENKFEDLIAWQKSRETLKLVLTAFEKSKFQWFREQLFRACLSVTNNIAEGFERNNKKQFIYLLNISKASCGEVRSMIYTAEDMGYCDDETADTLKKMCLENSKIIQGLINYQKSKIS